MFKTILPWTINSFNTLPHHCSVCLSVGGGQYGRPPQQVLCHGTGAEAQTGDYRGPFIHGAWAAHPVLQVHALQAHPHHLLQGRSSRRTAATGNQRTFFYHHTTLILCEMVSGSTTTQPLTLCEMVSGSTTTQPLTPLWNGLRLHRGLFPLVAKMGNAAHVYFTFSFFFFSKWVKSAVCATWLVEMKVGEMELKRSNYQNKKGSVSVGNFPRTI